MSDDLMIAKLQQLTLVRKALGWSEETCAHHLGVTYSTLHRWEHGETLPRSAVVIDAIDRFLARYGTSASSGGLS